MWQIYNELIEAIPEEIIVRGLYQTDRWTVVISDAGVGGGMVYLSEEEMPPLSTYIGQPLKTVALLVKSWNFQLASIGLAAINSYFNQEDKLQNHNQLEIIGYTDIFNNFSQHEKEDRIGMIGHFYHADKLKESYPNLYVFDLQPKKGDYPFSAEEFLLPEMDYIYMTGSTLVNKSLPRLLELGKNAEVTMVGGSTTLSDVLIKHGVNQLAGTLLGSTIKKSLENGEKNIALHRSGTPVILKERGKD